ncbi:MAG TPA: UDP-3-O-(3-hydroxymyristoyl)glucosamine N-acyltransferase [Terriglobales bacterium]|nr:UDP-3-O-(3-hydroxymyristoyl)glucosamine N-acyltransferase [Terriglobales bacterium]
MKYSLKEIAEAAGAKLVGNAALEIGGVAAIPTAEPDDLVFAESEALLEEALASRAGAVVTGEFGASAKTNKPLLISPKPRLAFIRAAAFIRPHRRREPGVHSTAIVHESAKLGKGVSVAPYAVIGESVVIGERTRIGPGACISSKVKIGVECYVDAHVTIYSGTTLGNRVTVLANSVLGSDGFGYVRDETTGRYEKFPQLGTLEIGDDVEIGAGCTVDRGALGPTVIERGVKLDNLVHVAHNVRIGENVVIAAQTGISGSSVVEKDVIVGGQVGIADHVRIEEGAILGAQSGIPSKKVIRGKGVVFWGTPARPIKEYLKELAALARLARKER